MTFYKVTYLDPNAPEEEESKTQDKVDRESNKSSS